MKSKIKQRIDSFMFNSRYSSRNAHNCLVMLKTLEVQYYIIDQYVFIENSRELEERLSRLGFKIIDSKMDGELNKYTTVMYDDEYNVAFHLFPSQHAPSVKTAWRIANESKSNDTFQIFLAGLKVLTADIQPKKKEILMG